MYQALYRKWRPSTFDEVIGQEHITQTLKNQVIANKLSHAYLFIGSRGTGKTTCARILSRAVNCEAPVNGNPCGVCKACRSIMDGSCTDVVELDAASNNGVDNVRALREEAVFSPASVKCRVYIIDEVHMLSTAAFNALLKILEEPPAHLMFILATTELHKVPATILSRCQRHTFKRIETGMLSDYLMKVSSSENISLSPDAAGIISVLSDGGVRDALSILDQCSGSGSITPDTLYQIMGLSGSETLFSVLDGIISHDTSAVLDLFKEQWMEGKDPVSFLDGLRALFRDILIIKAVKGSSDGLISGRFSASKLKAFADKLTIEQLISAIDTVQNSFLGIKYTANTRLSAEICLISLCDDLMTDDLASVKARISVLENELSGILSGGLAVKAADQKAEKNEASFVPTEPAALIEPERTESAVASVQNQVSESDEADGDPATFGEKLMEVVKLQLPVDLRYSIEKTSDFSFALVDNVLKIEAEPILLFGRVNRPAIIQIFSKAASEITGRNITVTVAKLASGSADSSVSGKIEELKKFPEVKIIN